MDERRFWEIVEASSELDEAGERFLVPEALEALSTEELLAFEQLRLALMRRSYTAELWGAAYVFMGGCSDDWFEYFRAGLIMMGQAVFDGVLADPDWLSEVEEEVAMEEAGYLVSDIVLDRTGEEPDIDFQDEEELALWDFEDTAEMKKRYPKLAARYLE